MEVYRPKVILSAAVSIDGKLSTVTGDSKLSSKKDTVRLHKIRSRVDAILVGKNTVLVDDPLLTVRHTKGKNPIRIIVDSCGAIPSKSRIIRTASKVQTIVAVSERATKSNIGRLSKQNVQVIKAGKHKVDIKKVLGILAKQNIRTILAEGGGSLNWELVRLGLVDELILTISPCIVGGKDAVTLVDGQGFSKISKSPKFRLYKISRQKNEVVLHYI